MIRPFTLCLLLTIAAVSLGADGQSLFEDDTASPFGTFGEDDKTEKCEAKPCQAKNCPTASCAPEDCAKKNNPTASCPTASCPTASCPTASCPTASCPTAGCAPEGCTSDSPFAEELAAQQPLMKMDEPTRKLLATYFAKELAKYEARIAQLEADLAARPDPCQSDCPTPLPVAPTVGIAPSAGCPAPPTPAPIAPAASPVQVNPFQRNIATFSPPQAAPIPKPPVAANPGFSFQPSPYTRLPVLSRSTLTFPASESVPAPLSANKPSIPVYVPYSIHPPAAAVAQTAVAPVPVPAPASVSAPAQANSAERLMISVGGMTVSGDSIRLNKSNADAFECVVEGHASWKTDDYESANTGMVVTASAIRIQSNSPSETLVACEGNCQLRDENHLCSARNIVVKLQGPDVNLVLAGEVQMQFGNGDGQSRITCESLHGKNGVFQVSGTARINAAR